MEHGLGVKLFERGRRATHLTAKGQELVGMAEELEDLVWRIRGTVGATDAISGFLRLGVADLIGLTWLCDFVAQVRQAYPAVTLSIDIGLAVDLVERLRRRELDVVLAPAEMWTAEFDAHGLGSTEFVWMVGKDFAIPEGTLTPRDFQDWPVITLSQQSYHHRIVNEWFRNAGILRRDLVFCNSIDAIASLTRLGLGIGLVPPICVADDLASGSLRILDCSPQIPPIRFFSLLPIENAHPLGGAIAALAAEVSTFGDVGDIVDDDTPSDDQPDDPG